MSNTIRPIAAAVIRRPKDGKHLVTINDDDSRHAFRMLGGGINFGEKARKTVMRELKEEIGAVVKVGKRIDTYEEILPIKGKPHHLIVFLFEVEFEDSSFYDMEKIPMIDPELKGKFAEWIDISSAKDYGLIRME